MKKILILFIFFKLINSNIKAQSIGDFYQGGVVFYLDSFGGGLIVDIADLSNPNPVGGTTSLDTLLSRWGNYSNHVPGTSLPFLGSGETNTQNFINFYSNGNFAAHLCVNSNRGGYNDWFLPSKQELEEIFSYKALIDSVALINGGHLFDDFATLYPYWSSTETPSTTDYRNAYAVYPGNFSVLRGKILEYKVRATRSFRSPINSITNIETNENKKVIKVFNLLGQESIPEANTILIFLYSDGSVEKKISVK
jgi:hypothetical protein